MKSRFLNAVALAAIPLLLPAIGMAQEMSFTKAEMTPMTCDKTYHVQDLADLTLPKVSKTYNIILSVPSFANPYIQALVYGAQKAADEAGVKLSVNAGGGFMDPASQITQVENALARHPDALMINPADPDALALTIDDTVDSGIPVLDIGTLSNSTESYKLVQDDFTMGAMGAEAMLKYLGDKGGKGIIVAGPANASWSRRRVAGFMSVAEKHPQLDVLAVSSTDIDPQAALTKFVNTAQAYPHIDWIYAAGSFLMAPQSVPPEYSRAIYVGGGLDNVTMDALKTNKMKAVLPDFPIGVGYLGMAVTLRILEGQDVPKRNCAPVAAATLDDLEDPVWTESSILPDDFVPLK